MLHLQKVLLIHLTKCVCYIVYKLKLPLHVSFKLQVDGLTEVLPDLTSCEWMSSLDLMKVCD